MVLIVVGFSLLGVVMAATAVFLVSQLILRRRGRHIPQHLDRLYARSTLVAYPLGCILVIVGDLTR